MRSSSVDRTSFKLFKKGSTTKVAASVSYSASSHKGILNPGRPLKRGATYRAVVTTSAMEVAGNRLAQNATAAGLQQKVWVFKVRK